MSKIVIIYFSTAKILIIITSTQQLRITYLRTTRHTRDPIKNGAFKKSHEAMDTTGASAPDLNTPHSTKKSMNLYKNPLVASGEGVDKITFC